VESQVESPKLGVYGCIKDPVEVEADIFFSIVISDWNMLPIFLEVVRHNSIILL